MNTEKEEQLLCLVQKLPSGSLFGLGGGEEQLLCLVQKLPSGSLFGVGRGGTAIMFSIKVA